MFTGDASGVFLFAALHKSGFASQIASLSRDDGMKLYDLLITAVCRCAPPDNKPSRSEIANCLPYLEQELLLMKNLQGFVALGRIAFENILSIYRAKRVVGAHYDFKHGGIYQLGDGLPWLVASYHPSQQNTLTGRLTVEMFDSIWQKVRALVE
jgi:uracil-DNA glycosylase family 4